jgi:hypothetical protein
MKLILEYAIVSQGSRAKTPAPFDALTRAYAKTGLMVWEKLALKRSRAFNAPLNFWMRSRELEGVPQ